MNQKQIVIYQNMKNGQMIDNHQTHNKALQLTVKSVAIFAKQKYAPLLPAAELGRYTIRDGEVTT